METVDLLQRSRHVANVQRYGEVAFAWISDTSLFLLRPVERRVPIWNLMARINRPGCQYEASCCDILAGEVTLLSEFNAKYSRWLVPTIVSLQTVNEAGQEVGSPETLYRAPDCHLSPDGQWLLWLTPSSYWIAVSLNGSRDVRWKCKAISGRSAFWTANSRWWVEKIETHTGEEYVIPQLRVFRVDEPESMHEISVQGLRDGILAGVTPQSTLLMRHPDRKRYRRDKAAVPPNADDPGEPVYEAFSETSFLKTPTQSRPFRIRLPRAGTVMEVVLSPDGTRLAWLIQEDLWAFGADSRYHLWLSDLAGEQVQEIGTAAGQTRLNEKSSSGKTYDMLHEMQWLPNSKSLSFTYAEGLWVVPITT